MLGRRHPGLHDTPARQHLLGAAIHLRISTVKHPRSVLGMWEAEMSEPLLQPQEKVSIQLPHQLGGTVRCGGRKERGRNDLLLPSLWGQGNSLRGRGGLGALPPRPSPSPRPPSLPEAHCLHHPTGEARMPGWLEMLFSPLFYTQCPRKTCC